MQYTQNLLIKNPEEILVNTVLEHETCITSYQEFQDKLDRPQIIVAGFMNLHCHLAYTELKIKSQDLFSWIRELVKIVQIVEMNTPNASLAGAREALSFGTTYLVDNSMHPEISFEVFQATGLRGMIGVEIFGSDPKIADQRFNEAIQKIQSNNLVEMTLSPHASYDVSIPLWQKLLAWCRQEVKPWLTHLAESESEEAWFQDKNAPQAQEARNFWRELGTLDAKLETWQSYPSSTQYLARNHLLQGFGLIAHMVHASKEDLEIIKEANLSLVTCPRSNLYLKNGLPDYQTWQELKIPFGIGTDSKASNHNLDLREEANSIPGLSSKARFELLTDKAAQVLGRKDLGTLDQGKAADYVILELQKPDIEIKTSNVFDLIMDTQLTKVKSTWVNGRECYNNNQCKPT